jgi:hypothetical protein
MTSHFEKTNTIVYLIDVSLPNLGNLQTAYAKKMKEYAELGIEVKQQLISRSGVYPTCPCICSRSHSSHCMMSSCD